MKKITTITAVAFLAISVVSCSKTSYSDTTSQPFSGHSLTPKPEVNVVSKWISPSVSSVETDRLGRPFIEALHPFTSSTQLRYDESSHVELAYVRIPTNQRIPYQYKRLPAIVNIVDNGLASDVLIDHSLDPGGLKIYFKDANYSFLVRAADQAANGNWNFRYIVIPKTKYETINIDWNDLPAVAAALNFPI